MRAREFVTEERQLPIETREPMAYAYELTGLDTSDPYKVYRFGVAMARARSDAKKDHVNPYIEQWSPHTAAGECAVIVGLNPNVDPIIDQALAMTQVGGVKKPISTPGSQEPPNVEKHSPIKSFKGYPR